MVLTPIPPGKLGAVVTSLEMRARPPLRPLPETPLRLVRWKQPSLETYRALFRRVGGPWLWFSRLICSDENLAAEIDNPLVEISAVIDRGGIEVGIVQLDFRTAEQCEIAFLGLVPELTGGGHGRWLMAQTLAMAWKSGIKRVWLHTCTLDHPSALGVYCKYGFTPISRSFDLFDDPRVAGIYPRETAPHIPLIEGNP